MIIKQKRGDSIVWECEYTDDAGAPVDLTSYSINCKAKGSDGILLFGITSSTSELDIHTPQSGLYRILIGDTTAYVPRDYRVDIQYTDGNSIVKSSETFTLKITEDVS